MGKAMEWLKNNWLTAIIWVFSTIAIVIAIVIVGAIIAVPFIGWHNFLEINLAELSRLFVFSVGGIGGAYGLQIAIKRQETFSHQGFNDRLGRGVESLSNDSVVIRCAGIRILVDLIDSAKETQKSIIVNIIYDFFRNNAKAKHDGYNKHHARSRGNSTQDLQDALDFLVNLPLDMQAQLRVNRKGQLDFRSLDFSYLTIECEKLEHADFSNSCFYRTSFFISEFGDVDFRNANFRSVHFTNVRFTNVRFWNVYFTLVRFRGVEFSVVNFRSVYFRGGGFMGGRFTNVRFLRSHFFGGRFARIDFGNAEINRAEFENTVVDDVVLTNVKFFRKVNFLGGEFHNHNEINISSNIGFPSFFGTDVLLTKFTFDADIIPSDFFELCYYDADVWPSDADNNPIDKVRGYRDSFFVKSAENWSDQPIDEWVAVECAQYKLRQEKEKDVASLEKELKNAEGRLREIQEELNLPKKTPNPPSH